MSNISLVRFIDCALLQSSNLKANDKYNSYFKTYLSEEDIARFLYLIEPISEGITINIYVKEIMRAGAYTQFLCNSTYTLFWG